MNFFTSMFVTFIILLCCHLSSFAQTTGYTLIVGDRSLEKLIKLEDLNGDGDALDQGESSVLLDGIDFGYFGNSLTIDQSGNIFVGIGKDGSGSILRLHGDTVSTYYDSTGLGPKLFWPGPLFSEDDGDLWVAGSFDNQAGIIKLEDINGDGDALDPGEVTAFFNQSNGFNIFCPSHLVITEDSCIFVIELCLDPGVIMKLKDFNRDGDFLDAGEFAGFSPNVFSFFPPTDLALNSDDILHALLEFDADGKIFRLEDLNNDGDVNDAGETNIFFDSLISNFNLTYPTALAFADDNAVFAAGNSDTILVMQDMNGDGDALDSLEAAVFFDNSGSGLNLQSPSVLVVKPSGVVSVEPVERSPLELPKNFSIIQNYPNPFNPQTTIRYSVPTKGRVQLKIFNIRGESVRVLLDEVRLPGEYLITWDGKNQQGKAAASGIYLLQLQADGITQLQKMTLIR